VSKKGEAVRAYKKAEELAPFNYEIYVLRGRKLEKDGDTKEALVLYKRALELKPDFVKLEEVIKSLEN
ncbi:tetratricopeptide repeat protein, partial [bacterium]|nr:tetratricopeptide repeat protein [bacterium]